MYGLNIVPVNDGIWRGPRPTTISHFNALVGTGVKQILDLQGDPWEVLTHSANISEWMAWDMGFSSTRLAMNGFFPPDRLSVRNAVEIIASHRLPIYVHCRQGVDRTGYVIAAYRMEVQKWTFENAVAEMMKLGFHGWWYWYWLPSLRRFSRA